MSVKVLVCGSRDYSDYNKIKAVLSELKDKYGMYTVIEGGQRGADLLAKNAALELGLFVIQKDADWKTYGKAAGPIRNRLMLKENPDFVIAFHSDINNSKGTKNMVNQSKAARKTVFIYS